MAAEHSYRDPSCPVEERVDDLLARMTLEEKAGLMFQPAITIGPEGALTEGSAELIAARNVNHFNIYVAPGARRLHSSPGGDRRLGAQSRRKLAALPRAPRHRRDAARPPRRADPAHARRRAAADRGGDRPLPGRGEGRAPGAERVGRGVARYLMIAAHHRIDAIEYIDEARVLVYSVAESALQGESLFFLHDLPRDE